MLIMRSDVIVPILAIFAVILASVAIIQPWWSVRTSPELQLMSNSTTTIDANLFKTLNVERTDGNETDTLSIAITNTTEYQDPASVPIYPFSYMFRTVTASRTDGSLTNEFKFSIGNLTSFAQQTKQIAETTNQTLPLALAGLVLTIVTMLLILVITRTKMKLERYTYMVGVLAAAILLIAPLQLAFGVTSFSGSFAIADRTSAWNGEVLAAWGPSIGWYLTIAAALVIAVCLLPVRTMYSDRRRGIQSLK